MKNYLFLILLGVLTYVNGNSQTADPRSKKVGKTQALAAGLYLPLDVFARSHVAGVGIDYSRSKHRFGKGMTISKKIGWVLNGGVNYYLGKMITTAGYDFRYGGYLNWYAMAGAMYNPVKNGNLVLTAGPAMNLYKGSVNAGLGINFLTSYFISETIAIGPGIIFKKHSNTDALVALTLRASYIF
jgi:hypothetical protein